MADDNNTITVELHGGQVDFNRKMFKDEAAWKEFKDRALQAAHDRDLREHGVDVEGLKKGEGPAGAIAEDNQRMGVKRDYRADTQPRSKIDDSSAHRAFSGESPAEDTIVAPPRKGFEAKKDLKAEYIDPDPEVMRELEVRREGGTSSAGAGRFFKRALVSGAEKALPDPTAIEDRRGGGGKTVDEQGNLKDMSPRWSTDTSPGAVGPAETLRDRGAARADDIAGRAEVDQMLTGNTGGGFANSPIAQGATAAGAMTVMQAAPAINAAAGVGVDPFGLNQSAPPAPGAPPPTPDQGAPPAAPQQSQIPAGPGVGLEKPDSPEQLKATYDKLGAHYKEAVRTAADIEAYRADVGRNTTRKAEQHAADDVAHQRQMQEFVENEQRDLVARTKKARDILNDPVKTPDKERYWQNHSKALFALGVALTAAGKGDVGAIIGSVNSRIAQDIQEQKDAYEEPHKRANEQIKANDQIFTMLRNMGHDSYEATKIGAALYADQMSAEAKRIAASSESALKRANADAAAAQFDMKAQKDYQDALEHNRTYAVQRAQTGVSAYNAQTERMRAVQAGGNKEEPVPEQPLQKLANIPTALDSIGRLFKDYKASGPLSPFKNKQYGLTTEAEAGSMAAGNTPNARENAELMKDFKAGLPGSWTPNGVGTTYFANSMRAMLENADNQVSILESTKKYDKGQIRKLRSEVDAARDRLIKMHPELAAALPNAIPTSPAR